MKMFIGYVSLSGNTEEMANILKNTLLSKGCEVDMESLETVEVQSLLDYDCIFIGTYTWGDGDLPYEAEDFYHELLEYHLTGQNAACFGSGDHAYPNFCAAVDTISHQLIQCGCNVFPESLKIELDPQTEDKIRQCQQFAQSVYEWVLLKKEMNQRVKQYFL
ncbi:flavodoxin [Neobacillus thermocopriae]|uniref:flavodoxin n=1 Tax=Neobacillus thermocopriae TaxID=1215031 RepID=UPI002E1DD6EA|nr:flavodoxin [Neobacillus thermocopriae]MED3625120.1 flavodoxin [Neobacillus thermocopriae]MED3714741.1 flavodoxin [Neobacillus thermocopriae]